MAETIDFRKYDPGEGESTDSLTGIDFRKYDPINQHNFVDTLIGGFEQGASESIVGSAALLYSSMSDTFLEESGINPEVWDSLSYSDKTRLSTQTYNLQRQGRTPEADPDAISYSVARAAGWLVPDLALGGILGKALGFTAKTVSKPLTQAITKTAVEHPYRAAMASGTLLGAVDQSLYTKAQTGEVDPTQVGIGAVAGATGGALGTKLGKYALSKADEARVQRANETLRIYEEAKHASSLEAFKKGMGPLEHSESIIKELMEGDPKTFPRGWEDIFDAYHTLNKEDDTLRRLVERKARKEKVPKGTRRGQTESDFQKYVREHIEAVRTVDDPTVPYHPGGTVYRGKGGKFRSIEKDIKKAADDYFSYSSALKKLKAERPDTAFAGSRGWAQFNRIVQPMSSRIKQQDRSVWNNLRRMDMWVKEQAHRWNTVGHEFFTSFRKLKRLEDSAELDKMLYRGDYDQIEQLFKKHGFDTKPLKGLKSVFAEHAKQLGKKKYSTELGDSFKPIDNYFPNRVKDIRGLQNEIKYGPFAEDFNKFSWQWAKKHQLDADKLSESDLKKIFYAFTRKQQDVVQTELAGLKSRRLSAEQVTGDLFKYYHSPEDSFHLWVRSSVDDLGKRRFFGIGDDINTGLERLLSGKAYRDSTTGKEIASFLNLRFGYNPDDLAQSIQYFKDTTYMALLANPFNALVQLGDISLAAIRNGTINTTKAMVKVLTGRNQLSVREMGLIDDIMEEFVSTAHSHRWTSFAFKYSVFREVDRLGKSVLVNSALEKNFKAASTVQGRRLLTRKWADAFETEWPEVLTALKNGEVTDGVKLMAFHSLADVQPISRSELPTWYAQNVFSRLFYTLRTFSIKHMNLMREDIFREYRLGNSLQATKNLIKYATMFTMAGVSVDAVRTYLKGDEPVLEEMVWDNLWSNTAIITSKYQAEKLTRSDPVTQAVGIFAPPVSHLDPMFVTARDLVMKQEFNEEAATKGVRYIPIVGPIFYEWFLKER